MHDTYLIIILVLSSLYEWESEMWDAVQYDCTDVRVLQIYQFASLYFDYLHILLTDS